MLDFKQIINDSIDVKTKILGNCVNDIESVESSIIWNYMKHFLEQYKIKLKVSSGKSENTMQSYFRDLNQYHSFLDTELKIKSIKRFPDLVCLRCFSTHK